MSGELPADQINRLSGGGRYKANLIKSLKQKKFITTYYRDKLRGYRLTVNSKNALLAENRERFESLLTGSIETNQPNYEITRRLRMQSIAETLVTMQNIGVKIYKDDKPDIFSVNNNPEETISVTFPVFYNSREIKELGSNFVKIHGARSVGVLLTESTIFVAYNTCGSLMKWKYNSEIRVKGLISNTLCRERLPHQYRHDDIRGLMLGDSMEQVYQLLTSSGGSKRNYFVLDSTYNNFIYLPNDYNGEAVLKLLCDTEKTNELNHILSQDLDEHNPGMLVENDAVDKNGYPVLFAYDCDMPRIVRFNSAITNYSGKGTIICFDFQVDALKRYCCDDITFQSIKIDKFKRRFFP